MSDTESFLNNKLKFVYISTVCKYIIILSRYSTYTVENLFHLSLHYSHFKKYF